MVCYLHPDRDGIVTCGNCGVAMCAECNSNAFYKTDNGKGKPLCQNCSISSAESNAAAMKSWLIKRGIKLVITAIFVLLGTIQFCRTTGWFADDAFFTGLLCWAIGGIISKIGNKEPPKPQTVSDAIYEYKHPFSSMIIKFIFGVLGYAIAAPVFVIFGIISFLGIYFSYKREKSNLSSMHIIVSAESSEQ